MFSVCIQLYLMYGSTKLIINRSGTLVVDTGIDPTGKRCRNDVVFSSMRRSDVLTSV